MEAKIVKWSDRNSPQLTTINLELTNYCNYKCTFCLNNNDDFRKKGFAANSLINKVIEEIDENVHIAICGIGEPSLHPDFEEIVSKLSEKFKNMSIVTNGYLFRNSSLINAVLNSTINKINLSLDYINPDEYQKVKSGDLSEVIAYLKNFLQARKNHVHKPMVQVNYLYEKEKKDYFEAIAMMQGLIDDPWCIYIRKIKDLACQMCIDEEPDEDYLDVLLKDYRSEQVVVENWNRYLQNTNFKQDNPQICRHIYNYYMLLWNGDVVPCCIDFNASMVLCNVINENRNLTDLFYSDIYIKFRAKMESLDYRQFPLCRHCNDYYKA